MTGVSGSGKTTLILESLIPALESMINGTKLPSHVKNITAEDIEQVKLIDAAPIGINVRSTVATYANVHDELRKVYAKLPDAKEAGYKAGDFLTIQENCVARPAMEQVLSALMCSFYRMWKYLVRIVMEADITGTLGILKGKQSLESYILCRN